VRHTIELNGGAEGDYRKLLTASTAREFKALCGVAVEQGLGVFVCFYG
jgi:hypothetical protein